MIRLATLGIDLHQIAPVQTLPMFSVEKNGERPMTGYKTILIVFRSPGEAERLCLLAGNLAGIWQSHVLGFHARPGVSVNVGLRGDALRQWLDEKRKSIDEQEADTKAIFERFTLSPGQSWEWRRVDAGRMPSGDMALDLARCADLVLINRLQNGSSLTDPDMTLEQLMFESGRPVLVIPMGYRGRHTAERIVVAWNGTLEATRAAFDSLPLLSNVSSDCIRLVCPPVPDKGPSQLPRGADFAEALARHGIEAEVRALPGRHSDAGLEILAQCEEFGADLLVMGAYGHSRLREYVFGGTTETILNDSRIPVLISR